MAPVKKPMAFALESRQAMEYRYQDSAAFSKSYVISYHCHFKPGCKIIQEAETGASHRKYIFKETLFTITGPEIQIIHIKAFDLYSMVHPHS